MRVAAAKTQRHDALVNSPCRIQAWSNVTSSTCENDGINRVLLVCKGGLFSCVQIPWNKKPPSDLCACKPAFLPSFEVLDGGFCCNLILEGIEDGQ